MSMIWADGDRERSAGDESNKLTVETINNHVYFYADVDSDRVLALLGELRRLDATLRNEHATRQLEGIAPLTPIWLHVQSGGGDLFAGFSAADQLQTIATPVYSIVEGYCASAATLISMACKRRFIQPNAFVLIHQLSSCMGGKYEEFRDEMRVLDMAMRRMVMFYAARSRLTPRQAYMLLRHDSWFGAQDCLRIGLVDEIMENRR